MWRGFQNQGTCVLEGRAQIRRVEALKTGGQTQMLVGYLKELVQPMRW
jgi:hypothetical protein